MSGAHDRRILKGWIALTIWSAAGKTLAAPVTLDQGMIADIVIFPILMIVVAFVIWVLVTEFQRQRRLRLILDQRLRMFERLASSNIANISQEDFTRTLIALAAARSRRARNRKIDAREPDRGRFALPRRWTARVGRAR
ncbi:MAG: hypothetical protein HC850_16410 [Rhodomicrobium sp.]|nr:hypothetical protein [Rhodomicrobium sp.]